MPRPINSHRLMSLIKSTKVNWKLAFSLLCSDSCWLASVGELTAQQLLIGAVEIGSSVSLPTNSPAVMAVEMAAIGRMTAIKGPNMA